MTTGAIQTRTAPKAASVDVDNVSLSYGATRVLKGINLSIRPGEMFSFLGPSGCGKTTLLRLIAGFAQANEGTVSIAGTDIGNLPPWKRDVGLVFQSYALWPHMTVARNVAFGLEERRVPRAEIGPRVDAALDLVGLKPLADRRPSELSGGQQQRVALARTLVIEPKVLLLDEPLSNLDARLRVEVRRELRELQQRLGITTIFVTHDQEEANTISDRIAVMNDGVVQQIGTPMELYDKPANLFVAGFLGTANVLTGTIASNGAERMFEIAGGARWRIPPTQVVKSGSKLVFRPQTVEVTDPRAPQSKNAAAIAGTIAHREFLGASIRYGVKIPGSEILADVPFRANSRIWETGSSVALVVPEGSAIWVSE